MKIKKIFSDYQKFLLLLLFAAFLILQYSRAENVTTESLFLSVFCAPGPIERTGILNILTWFCLYILFFFTVSDTFPNDLKVSATYVFPRVGTKRKWILEQTLILSVKVILIWAILFLICYAVSMATGIFQIKNVLFYAELFAGIIFPTFLLASLQNVLSIRIGSLTAFLIIILVFLLSVLLGMAFYETNPLRGWLFALLPPLGILLQWHEAVDLPVAVGYSAVPGFALWKSLLVSVLYLASAYGYLYCKIEAVDLYGFMEGENENARS